MGIDAKAAYRFGFLKSERWKNIRLVCLVHNGDNCVVCGKRSHENDVHHIYYPERWEDTRPGHVVTLCRQHHKSVHKLMRRYPMLSMVKAVKYLRTEWQGFWSTVGKIQKYGFNIEPSEKKEERYRLFASIKKLKRELTVSE